MKTAATAIRILISLTGVTLLVLGVLFWTGRALGLLPLHMRLGALLVLLLWVDAGLAVRARVAPRLIVATVVWSLVMPVFGVLQMRLLPGSMHWLIQVAHLLVGVIAIGLGHALARGIARPSAPA